MPLPRSGPELLERIGQRWRWFAYRVQFHPWTTNELPRILGTIHDYIRLMRLDRPIGIYLLLWPTLWAVWIAGRGKPDAHVFLIFVLGVVLMRSAGCAINDYADRSFDPLVERTKTRPLAAGRITTLEALILFAVLSLLALQETPSPRFHGVAAGLRQRIREEAGKFFALPPDRKQAYATPVGGRGWIPPGGNGFVEHKFIRSPPGAR